MAFLCRLLLSDKTEEATPSAGSNMPRPSLLLLSLIIVALAIDHFAFDDQYRTAVWRDAVRQVQMLEYKATRYLENAGYWGTGEF